MLLIKSATLNLTIPDRLVGNSKDQPFYDQLTQELPGISAQYNTLQSEDVGHGSRIQAFYVLIRFKKKKLRQKRFLYRQKLFTCRDMSVGHPGC